MRYEPVTAEVISLYEEVKREHFPELSNINVLILLDTKKSKTRGKLLLGKIKKATDVERFLTTDITDEGFDCVMFLDKNMTRFCEDVDIKRIIRRQLRCVFITEHGKPTLIGPDYTDFREEMELNIDDPNWYFRTSEMVGLIYEQGEE